MMTPSSPLPHPDRQALSIGALLSPSCTDTQQTWIQRPRANLRSLAPSSCGERIGVRAASALLLAPDAFAELPLTRIASDDAFRPLPASGARVKRNPLLRRLTANIAARASLRQLQDQYRIIAETVWPCRQAHTCSSHPTTARPHAPQVMNAIRAPRDGEHRADAPGDQPFASIAACEPPWASRPPPWSKAYDRLDGREG